LRCGRKNTRLVEIVLEIDLMISADGFGVVSAISAVADFSGIDSKLVF
jgi:hypothetical protein